MYKKIMVFSGIGAILIVLFGVFIYPTIYKFDKLDQKYPVRINRLTGDTQILRNNGWTDVDPTTSEISKIRNEIQTDFNSLRMQVTEEITKKIRDDVVASLKNEIQDARAEVAEYKKFETDQTNYFTIGSSKEEVKNIMGTPTQTNSYFDTWYYGFSTITFKNGKVSEYNNQGKNLRVR